MKRDKFRFRIQTDGIYASFSEEARFDENMRKKYKQVRILKFFYHLSYSQSFLEIISDKEQIEEYQWRKFIPKARRSRRSRYEDIGPISLPKKNGRSVSWIPEKLNEIRDNLILPHKEAEILTEEDFFLEDEGVRLLGKEVESRSGFPISFSLPSNFHGPKR